MLGKEGIFLFILLLGLMLNFNGNCEEKEEGTGYRNLENLGYVVVSPKGPIDGSDFGPNTKGTKTGGIQEALNYAKANNRDVYIVGPGVYSITETIRVPWMQDARIDGGEYVIDYSPPTGDAITIDSVMDCWYRFGLIVCHSNGAVVRFKPETPGPDKQIVITDSVFEFSSVVGGCVWKDTGLQGSGIVLDASLGAILNNRISAVAVLMCNIGVYLPNPEPGRAIIRNWIQVSNNHGNKIGLQIGDPGAAGISENRFDMSIRGGSAAIKGDPLAGIGARIFGQQNILTLNVSETPPGKNIIFEADAKDNIVHALSLPQGITNNARTPTNRIISCSPVGFNVTTPSFPASGKDVVNTNPYPVEIIILSSPGKVSDWTITDANGKAQKVSAGLSAGERFILDPGDKIRFTYWIAPEWRWRALR